VAGRRAGGGGLRLAPLLRDQRGQMMGVGVFGLGGENPVRQRPGLIQPARAQMLEALAERLFRSGIRARGKSWRGVAFYHPRPLSVMIGRFAPVFPGFLRLPTAPLVWPETRSQ